MAWIPTTIIDGGMYGGNEMPVGTLTGFANSYLENTAVQNHTLLGNGQFESKQWEGAFGVNAEEMVDYALGKKDGQSYEVDLFEIVVENPEGAQYYRQSLLMRGYITCSTEQTNTVTISGDTYSASYVQITLKVGEIYRKEYPTPYSTPTVTRLSAVASRQVFFTYITSGDEIAVGAGYKNYILKRCRVAFGDATYNNVEYYGQGIYVETKNLATGVQTQTAGGLLMVDMPTLQTAFGGTFKPQKKEDPNEDPHEKGGGYSGEGGGDGEQDKHQDAIPIPDLPPLSGTTAGFVTVYEMTTGNMQTFAAKMYDPDIWGAIKAFFSDPMDFICGLLILPFAPHTSGHAKPKFGLFTWDYFYPTIVDQYQEIDCGSLQIPNFYNSCFDFDPYTKIKIWLPYIGYRDLLADEVMGNTLHVKYHVDVMSGDCVAFITRTAFNGLTPVTQVIAQFSGNCGVRVPFGRQSFDAAIQTSVQLMAGALGNIAGAAVTAGGLESGGGGLAGSQIDKQVEGATIAGVNASKTKVERSGVAGASAGYMSIQYPYIIRQIPKQSLPHNYRDLEGYPANIAGPLNKYTGYAAVEIMRLQNCTGTDAEKDEIMSLLKGGVII